MFKLCKVLAVVCIMAASVQVFAQSAKPKTAKPAAKAAAAKKIDYAKMKADIKSLYRSDKFKEVIGKAAQYLVKFPKDTQVTMQKAISHVALKQYPEGFTLVKNFFTPVDTAAKYLAIMAFSVPEDDLLTSGLKCGDEAIKVVPEGPWGYFVKGGIYSDLKQHDKALPFMEEMSKRLRNDNEQFLMGHFYPKELSMNNKYDEAIAGIEALDKKFPNDEEITNAYAFIHRFNKKYEKAITKYDELIKMQPDNVNYQLWKASAYNDMGNNTEACAVSEKIILTDSTYDFLRFRYNCPAYFAKPALSDIKKAVWEVSASGNNYDFEASNLNGSTDSDFEFNWSMTSGSDANGHVKITKDAMEKATAQNNYFGPSMKNVTFTDKTTVWVSKTVINNLLTTGTCKMDLGGGEEEFTRVPNTTDERDDNVFETKINVKGQQKYLSTLHVKNADGSHDVWILNDANNPMIVKMRIEWEITLKSIE
jgi:tetratricopeptide (TPR) repeat protein